MSPARGATSTHGDTGDTLGTHQDLGVHWAGSTLLGVTVKVLSRMLMTGRALGRDWGQLSPPCSVPTPGGDRTAVPCPRGCT